MNTPAIFDIETAPDLEAVRRITPPFDPASVKGKRPAAGASGFGASSSSSLATAATTRDVMEQAEADYWAGALQRATLNPATARICAIGLHFPREAPLLWTSSGVAEDGGEAELLRRFWREFLEWDGPFAYWSGNNGRGSFDARFLVVRSWVNRVAVPAGAFGKERPGELSPARWVDLAPVYLVGAEANSFCSANTAARTLGLIGRDLGWAVVQDKRELEQRGAAAASVHELFAAEDPLKRELALEYLRNDLALERAISDVLLGKERAA